MMRSPAPAPAKRFFAVLAAIIALLVATVPNVLRHSGKFGTASPGGDAILGAGVGVLLGLLVVTVVKGRRTP